MLEFWKQSQILWRTPHHNLSCMTSDRLQRKPTCRQRQCGSFCLNTVWFKWHIPRICLSPRDMERSVTDQIICSFFSLDVSGLNIYTHPIFQLTSNYFLKKQIQSYNLPRIVSVRTMFFMILSQNPPHMASGGSTMGSKWLSCILTSTCFCMLLVLKPLLTKRKRLV